MLNETTTTPTSTTSTLVLAAGSTSTSNSDENLSIQIEVDIDPPPRRPDDPSDEELERLGLPTHHVHYSASAAATTAAKMKDDDTGNKNLKAGGPGNRLVRLSASERLELFAEEGEDLTDGGGDRYESFSANYDAALNEVEPPRALPDREEAAADLPHQDELEYRDRVYEIDAFCNLDCGFEGECFMERESGGDIKKRCLCPHGKFGEKCSMGT